MLAACCSSRHSRATFIASCTVHDSCYALQPVNAFVHACWLHVRHSYRCGDLDENNLQMDMDSLGSDPPPVMLLQHLVISRDSRGVSSRGARSAKQIQNMKVGVGCNSNCW